jgi:hypothetical protein
MPDVDESTDLLGWAINTMLDRSSRRSAPAAV